MVYQTNRFFTGWGRAAGSAGQLAVLAPGEDPRTLLAQNPARGMIARGLGRSYGDSAQNSGGAVVQVPTGIWELDQQHGTLTAAAGTSLDEIMRVIVPQGWFVPVTPGTRYATVGGAIAADVHGKNHHVDGTFGAHVRHMNLLLADGSIVTVAPDDPNTRELFYATIGGMGLTGIILQATFGLKRIESSRILVDTWQTRDLDDLMSRMVAADDHATYSVAWIDSASTGAKFGRGVLTTGEHAPAAALSGSARRDPFAYSPAMLASAPGFLPRGLLNRWSVAAFNEVWYRKAPQQKHDEVQSIPMFFHPLDGVGNWNRIYGPGGFLQYQFAVPDSGAELISTALHTLQAISAPSFLSVLKRFGPQNLAPLSFPTKGWTLALDIPALIPDLGATLDRLDELVIAAGGRLYLAKDSRALPAIIAAGYPRLAEFQQVRDQVDPHHFFRSDQSRRLGL